MTDKPDVPSDDNSRDEPLELDYEDCMNKGHCHRPRSLRQETTITEDGKRRVCHRPAGWGTDHVGFGACKLHMGSVPNVRKHAARLRAQNDVQTLGLPLDVDPAEALLDEVRRTAGHVAWLGRMIAGIENPDDLVWGLSEETLESRYSEDQGKTVAEITSGKMVARESIWYQMYAKERKHLAAVCKAALDAGINERIVKVYEQLGDTFLDMFDRVLEELRLTDEQRRKLPGVMERQLRGLSEE